LRSSSLPKNDKSTFDREAAGKIKRTKVIIGSPRW